MGVEGSDGVHIASSVGRVEGRANALTLLLPLSAFGRWWVMGLFWLLRQRKQRYRFIPVDRLRFIYAIRWTLLPPFEPVTPGRTPRREQRWQMLFESNFDGDWDEYLNAFGAVLGAPLHQIVRYCIGYPGMDDVGLFKAYAKSVDHLPEHYASSYPDLTAIDIRQRLLSTRGPSARQRVEREGYGRTHPYWATFLMPVKPGHSSQAVYAARQLDDPSSSHPLRPTSLLLKGRTDVHFARVAVVDQVSRSWILFTLVHDGDAATIVRQMLAVDAARSAMDGGSPLHDLLSHVDGMPAGDDGWNDDDVAALVLAHQPTSVRHTVGYSAYPTFSAGEIQALQDLPVSGAWPSPEDRS